ncbi:hypothetical protein BJ165DRAFT_1610035 [Panaeolus papilionaceus]|nr:hypothetical protein BJ165DRAFT_1610035 [Panaeolus papilionaceus]
MDVAKFSRLVITGGISVLPLIPKATQNSRWYCCVLMGSTGAGKSCFIENFAGKLQQLCISKDQLTSYTQEVSAYQVMNVTYQGRPICLVDTPGFSDTKMSEMEIMDKVYRWLKDNGVSSIASIFFFIPINGTRLAGTKRRTIEMLKAFLSRTNSLCSVIFVTTMWDTLHNKRAQDRGESNFVELRFEIFKEFMAEHANITRFMNTQASALQILDENTYGSRALSTNVTALPQFYQDLHERIESALQRKRVLESDPAYSDPHADPELKGILHNEHRENEEILAKFIRQFVEFGDPPVEFRDAHHHLQQIVDPGHMIRLFGDFKPGEAVHIHDQFDLLYFDVMEGQITASDQTVRNVRPNGPNGGPLARINTSLQRWREANIVKRFSLSLLNDTKRYGKKWLSGWKD